MADPIAALNAALSGRYSIERQIGQGGMATVYLAEDLKHHRKVALKVLKPELSAIVGAERFLAEIHTTASLQHPHILPLFDSGEADNLLFYVMPHVEGESLRDRLDREHQLPVDEAVRIATNVAEALDYAHRRGVIHRDIKPANLLLLDGKPVISDFGIALAVSAGGGGRMTETGLSLGTPHYMSPEQATGDLSVGPATDIYALGCVLYEMLIGEPPYTGSTPQAILGKIITGDAKSVTGQRRSVPANVDAAIRKALERLPADRFGSAGEFVKALGDPGFRHGAGAGARMIGGRAAWGPLQLAVAGVAVVATLVAGWFSSAPSCRNPSRALYSPRPRGWTSREDPTGSRASRCPRMAGRWSSPTARRDSSIGRRSANWTRCRFQVRETPGNPSSPRTASGSDSSIRWRTP
jgi:serine/threonine-protein kinase